MSELWLVYFENGEKRRIAVTGDLFTVGRHSQTDLPIADGRLSREHLRLRRLGLIYTAEDAGSSNGSRLNGQQISGPAAISHGDILDLGGVELTVETSAGINAAAQPEPSSAEPATPDAAAAAAAPVAASAAASSNSGGIPFSLFIIAPILGLLIVGGVIGSLLLFGGKSEVAHANDDFVYSSSDDGDDDASDVSKTSNKKADDSTDAADDSTTKGTDGGETKADNSGTNTATTSGGDGSSPGSIDISGKPADNSEAAKIQHNGTAFLRRIGRSDRSNAFITKEQAAAVAGKVKQTSRMSAVAQNITAARKNSTQIKALAQSVDIAPQLLAVAGIARLGGKTGDVMSSINEAAQLFAKIKPHLNNEYADDALLMMAIYDRAQNDDILKFRNMLQELAHNLPQSAREIRTIWFLEKNGKITRAEFDRALDFLAIGIITQNPKDFGVSIEPLVL